MEKTLEKSKKFIDLCKSYGIEPTDVPEMVSFDDACKVLKLNPERILPDVSMFPERHQKALTATAKMYIIAEALNQDPATKELWSPDWNDWDVRKWRPWFDMEVDDNNPSGFRFPDTDCDGVLTGSTGGSRLCYRSEAICEFAGKHFLAEYKEMMVIQK